ncbi:hypothetical protein L6452_19119 [Arctium lappa]|uniref:Uncharacterized protein n=1 Tax=Arctium lappa TaxID=4217 RepID=A0ACB9B926_ARCLA|nr:hypothetical protein L6452_19119 [Arctium lappa]
MSHAGARLLFSSHPHPSFCPNVDDNSLSSSNIGEKHSLCIPKLETDCRRLIWFSISIRGLDFGFSSRASFGSPRRCSHGDGDIEMGIQSGELELDDHFKMDAHEEWRSVTKVAAMKVMNGIIQKPGCGQGTGVDRSRTTTTL